MFITHKCNKYINGVTLNINWGHLSHFLNPLSQLELDEWKNKFYILKYRYIPGKIKLLNQYISQLYTKWCKRVFLSVISLNSNWNIITSVDSQFFSSQSPSWFLKKKSVHKIIWCLLVNHQTPKSNSEAEIHLYSWTSRGPIIKMKQNSLFDAFINKMLI